MEAYSPLGNPGSPFREGDEPNILDDPVVKSVATEHGVTPAQVGNICTDTHGTLVCLLPLKACVHALGQTELLVYSGNSRGIYQISYVW